jgi:hypothetical protein
LDRETKRIDATADSHEAALAGGIASVTTALFAPVIAAVSSPSDDVRGLFLLVGGVTAVVLGIVVAGQGIRARPVAATAATCGAAFGMIELVVGYALIT